MPPLEDWLAEHSFSPVEIDCINTVMLKILDGKCKMASEEKIIMTALYHANKTQGGFLLKDDVHTLITQALAHSDEDMKMRVYEQRLLAETMLSRPVMKQFKARIRAEGLFALLSSNSAAL